MATGGEQGGVQEGGTAFVRAPAPYSAWTIAEFERMADRGAFGDTRAELIDGEIVKVSPKHVPHARLEVQLERALQKAIENTPELDILLSVSVGLSETYAPYPDLVVWDVQAATKAELQKFLPAKVVRILVEVSATTLQDDLGRKLAAYARSGVSEYWVADLYGRRIVQHSEPAGETYARVVEQPFGSTFPALTLPLTIDTSALADLRTE